VNEAFAQGLPVVIVRPGLVYGPGDLHLLGFFRTIDRGLFRPIGNRSVHLHPIYIDDLIEALCRCAVDVRAVGACLHIAGQQPVTLTELSTAIATALGRRPPQGRIPLPVAQIAAAVGDVLPNRLKALAPLTRSRLDFLTHSRVYDVSRAEAMLGFKATTDLPVGITRTVAWYRQQGYLRDGSNV
jgi:nucleoside-diphosphate-sugar epimerase